MNPPPHHKRFTAEDAPELFEQAIAIRRAVFVDEQGGPLEDEPDDYDGDAIHWLFWIEDSPVATCRLVSYQEACQMKPVAKLGRLAVLLSHRGAGLGRQMMDVMLADAKAEGFDQSILHAQSYAVPFYEKFGFETEGPEFEEGGIPHVFMRLVLSSTL